MLAGSRAGGGRTAKPSAEMPAGKSSRREVSVYARKELGRHGVITYTLITYNGKLNFERGFNAGLTSKVITANRVFTRQ